MTALGYEDVFRENEIDRKREVVLRLLRGEPGYELGPMAKRESGFARWPRPWVWPTRSGAKKPRVNFGKAAPGLATRLRFLTRPNTSAH